MFSHRESQAAVTHFWAFLGSIFMIRTAQFVRLGKFIVHAKKNKKWLDSHMIGAHLCHSICDTPMNLMSKMNCLSIHLWILFGFQQCFWISLGCKKWEFFQHSRKADHQIACQLISTLLNYFWLFRWYTTGHLDLALGNNTWFGP